VKTIVLDDDPTGTQSATGVRVLLEHDTELITDALRDTGSVYVQTNSRALHEADAVALVRRIRREGEEAAARLGVEVRFVLRGDSTLRGHVFAETEQFLDGDAVMLFVPAFPDGGRTTRGGMHYVKVDGTDVPAHESEYARDPVFPFASGILAEYVAEKSQRTAVPVGLDDVRAGRLAEVLRTAPAGSVVLPDAVVTADIEAIAAAANAVDRTVVVRSGAPLAAALAGVSSPRLLDRPLLTEPAPVLLVCGSHTAGATTQLDEVLRSHGPAEIVGTTAALDDPATEGKTTAGRARARLAADGLAIVASERTREQDHGTLDHGEKIMTALTTAVAELLPAVDVIVAKGGITSAEVARTGAGARSALVLGQVLPGVSVWRMTARDGREITYVVVPGNVGGPDTLVSVLDALGAR